MWPIDPIADWEPQLKPRPTQTAVRYPKSYMVGPNIGGELRAMGSRRRSSWRQRHLPHAFHRSYFLIPGSL